MSQDLDTAQVWADIEDHLIPFVRLDAPERAVYYQLFRHSRLEGRRSVRVSRRGLARSTGLGVYRVFHRLHSLARKGCIRIIERSHSGHLIEVLLPSEIPGCLEADMSPAPDLEHANCYRHAGLRTAILRRENGRCFYCLRRIHSGTATLDHLVPLAEGGDNSYRNVVACCVECNSRKSSGPAPEFLRDLYRRGCLSAPELESRLAALENLAAGSLKPSLNG